MFCNQSCPGGAHTANHTYFFPKTHLKRMKLIKIISLKSQIIENNRVLENVPQFL